MSENNNNFNDAFKIQKAFTEKLFNEKYNLSIDDLTREERLKWSKEYILSCSKEMYEMLDELNWKTHRFSTAEDSMDNFAEEGIDAFKFLLNLFIINGFDADYFYTKFIEKSIVVDIRYEQEKQLKEAVEGTQMYVVFDIDGILNDYPKNFIRYFQYLGYKYDSIEAFKDADLKIYKEVKNKFRVAGEERNCKVFEDGVMLLKKVKELGFGIILLTARPINKHTRLYFDTINWLNDNQIYYDFLFFSKDKEEYLINNFNPSNIVFVLDDQVENVNKLCRVFKTYLLFNESLNTESDLCCVNKKVTIVKNLNEIAL